MKALAPLRMLEEGMVYDVRGKSLRLCPLVLGLLVDMAQQQQNCGCLAVSADHGCRLCNIASTKRAQLDYDVDIDARSHYKQTRCHRMLNSLPTKKAHEESSTEHGIHSDPPAVRHIAPALDLIAGRPGDASHSELGGIMKMFHQLLLDAVSVLASSSRLESQANVSFTNFQVV